jgi:predicted protein tyrosine phosphatase
MPNPRQHTRIIQLPAPEPVAAARLDTFFVEKHFRREDFVLEYHAQALAGTPELFERDGKIAERVQGVYIPRRLRFTGIEKLDRRGLYLEVEHIPAGHPARTIVDLYSWRPKEKRLPFHLMFGRSAEQAEVRLYAHSAQNESRQGQPVPFSEERNWSPAPPMPAGLVPQPTSLHRRFGGDPITFRMDGREHHRRLFIGNMENQPEVRPDVHAVLNLGEKASRWLKGHDMPPASDRWMHMGEGSEGMTVNEIREEAQWVTERLRAGQRVLVHCVAGMNRSTTICCAALILLEGLSAEQALERVRQHHPWARPDSHHWIALKWIALGSEE